MLLNSEGDYISSSNSSGAPSQLDYEARYDAGKRRFEMLSHALQMVAGRIADRIVLKAGRVVSRTSVSVRTIDTDQPDDVVTALDAWNV